MCTTSCMLTLEMSVWNEVVTCLPYKVTLHAYMEIPLLSFELGLCQQWWEDLCWACSGLFGHVNYSKIHTDSSLFLAASNKQALCLMFGLRSMTTVHDKQPEKCTACYIEIYMLIYIYIHI